MVGDFVPEPDPRVVVGTVDGLTDTGAAAERRALGSRGDGDGAVSHLCRAGFAEPCEVDVQPAESAGLASTDAEGCHAGQTTECSRAIEREREGL